MREQIRRADGRNKASMRRDMDEMKQGRWTAGGPEDKGRGWRCKSGLMGRKRSSGVHNTSHTHTFTPWPQLWRQRQVCHSVCVWSQYVAVKSIDCRVNQQEVSCMHKKLRCVLWDGRLMSLNGRFVIKDSTSVNYSWGLKKKCVPPGVALCLQQQQIYTPVRLTWNLWGGHNISATLIFDIMYYMWGQVSFLDIFWKVSESIKHCWTTERGLCVCVCVCFDQTH